MFLTRSPVACRRDEDETLAEVAARGGGRGQGGGRGVAEAVAEVWPRCGLGSIPALLQDADDQAGQRAEHGLEGLQ